MHMGPTSPLANSPMAASSSAVRNLGPNWTSHEQLHADAVVHYPENNRTKTPFGAECKRISGRSPIRSRPQSSLLQVNKPLPQYQSRF